MSLAESIEKRAAQFSERYQSVYKQLGRVIVGHSDIVHGVLTCLFVGGHCLLEGVPGLGKTLLVRTLAQPLNLDFSRIQFTPDLMPADILGTNMIVEDQAGHREFQFQKGPIFTQICLADEINRATPKTQSALLEAMQERSVSIAGKINKLKDPFFFKLVVGYSSREELNTIIERTTKGVHVQADKVMDGTEILQWQQLVREVILAPLVQDYIARITLATHPDGPFAVPITNQYLRWGSSPRGAQTLTLAAKVRALLSGRYNVSFEDVRRAYLPAMRHRVILNFEAQAENIASDVVLAQILNEVPEKATE